MIKVSGRFNPVRDEVAHSNQRSSPKVNEQLIQAVQHRHGRDASGGGRARCVQEQRCSQYFPFLNTGLSLPFPQQRLDHRVLNVHIYASKKSVGVLLFLRYVASKILHTFTIP